MWTVFKFPARRLQRHQATGAGGSCFENLEFFAVICSHLPKIIFASAIVCHSYFIFSPKPFI